MEMLFSYVTSLKEILVGKKLSRLKSMLPIAHVFEKLFNKNCLNSNYPTMLMSTKIDLNSPC